MMVAVRAVRRQHATTGARRGCFERRPSCWRRTGRSWRRSAATFCLSAGATSIRNITGVATVEAITRLNKATVDALEQSQPRPVALSVVSTNPSSTAQHGGQADKGQQHR